MVNVNTPLPFNLHNRDVHGRNLDPSSSRSARSRSAHATMGGPAGYGPEMLPEVPSRMPSYSPTRDREPSPALETSRSTTSLRPGDASYAIPDNERESGAKRPILNIRLVRGGSFGAGGAYTSRPRQSRAPTRGRPGHSEGSVPEEERGTNGAVHAGSETGTEQPDSTPDTDFQIQSVGNITCSWGD